MKMEWRIVSWCIFVSLWRQCWKDRHWRSGWCVIRLRKTGRGGWDQMLPKPHVSFSTISAISWLIGNAAVIGGWGLKDEGSRCSAYRQAECCIYRLIPGMRIFVIPVLLIADIPEGFFYAPSAQLTLLQVSSKCISHGYLYWRWRRVRRQ